MEERKYWDPEIETMSINKLKELQGERLRTTVVHAYEDSAFYRRRFDAAGVKPSDIKSIEDVSKLPLLEDKEFRETPIEERITVPFSEVTKIGSSGGTTGIPSPFPRTASDWKDIVDRNVRVMWGVGIRPSDIVQIRPMYECFGIACSNLGANNLTICAGRGNMDNQIRLAQMLGATIIIDGLALLLQYLNRAEELGIHIKDTKIRGAWGIGEGWSDAYTKKMEKKWELNFLPRTYAASDFGSMVAYECEERNGLHISADKCLFEVIDPETQEPLGPGEEGELVVTTLTLKALPLIRWKASDIAALLPYEPCTCGRTLPKMSQIKGRFIFSVKVGEKRIYPTDVEDVVASVQGLGDEYQIIVDKPGELERLKVKVEVEPQVKDTESLKRETEKTFDKKLGVESEVEIVPIGTIERAMWKAQRLISTYTKD
jgi:phenylacetate-CoA ligase